MSVSLNPSPIGRPTSIEQRLAWITLARFPGITSRRLTQLFSRYHSAEAVLALTPRQLQPGEQYLVPLLGKTEAELELTRVLLLRAREQGIRIRIPPDPDFPALLRSIPDPPVLLYLRGDCSLLTRPAVAIVGSRNHSRYGRETAAMLAQVAAQAGVVVVSGMARGLDAEAHQGALDVGGGTIGVLGSGIGFIYPESNRPLYQKLEAKGLLVTEYPPEQRPHKGSFPRRNRLISGLAQVLVVVEAAHRSGTMLTVASALEQGRSVMAVPGPISSQVSTGTNQLLKDGAEPLLVPDDLLRHFHLALADGSCQGVSVRATPPSHLSPDEARVYDVLTTEPRLLDEITLQAGLPVGTTLALLCGLELGGLALQDNEGGFRRS